MPTSAVNEVYPNGDTLFILRHPGAPFATCAFAKQWPNYLPRDETEGSKGNEASAVEKHPSRGRTRSRSPELRFRLSSALLIETSSYFKKSLSERWNTLNPEPGYKWTLEGRDWDGEAFLLLMNILHNKVRAVPRKIGLEMVAKVAVLVDYYGCHEVLDLWADTWISDSDIGSVEPCYSRQLLLQLTIFWVFRKSKLFLDVTNVAVHESRGPIHTLGLPIPKAIVDAIEKRRIYSTRIFFEDIEKYGEKLNLHGVEQYGRSCLYMQLGYMDQSLSVQFLKPLPSEPYYGYSLFDLEIAIESFHNSVKCTCWSRNHLQELKVELRKLLDRALVFSKNRVAISDFEEQ